MTTWKQIAQYQRITIGALMEKVGELEALIEQNTSERVRELERRIDQLENEINAVEWMNGRIEKELFECRKKS